MKSSLAIFGALLLLSVTALAAPTGAQAIIKERAKELRDQNNVRQGVPPPAAPQQPAKPAQPPAAAATAAPAQVSPLAQLEADLTAIKTGTPATTEQKQRLTRDVLACASGGIKPSSSTAARLVENMTAGLAEKDIPAAHRNRLAQDVNGLLNGAAIQPMQMTAIIADVQAIFLDSGVNRKTATAIGDDAKAIATELQKTASK
jgi:hypothetical protein